MKGGCRTIAVNEVDEFVKDIVIQKREKRSSAGHVQDGDLRAGWTLSQ